MRICSAQINPTLGDFTANRRKIEDAIGRARAEGCALVVFPELSLMGYLPNDLLERPSIVREQLKEFARLCRNLPPGIAVLVGLVTLSGSVKGKPYRNSAALVEKGRKTQFFHKELLPTYDIFDEARHIEKGSLADGFFVFRGHKFLLTICEDIWGWDLPGHPINYLENPLRAFNNKNLDLIINMSASPFTFEKNADRCAVVSRTAKHFGAPMLYVNMVGAQDEVIFDGGSFAVDAKGKIIWQGASFIEEISVIDVKSKSSKKAPITKPQSRIERARNALVLGLRDYAAKTGINRAHLGLSGGIDSAVVLCLAVDALGSQNVTAIALPGPFSAAKSLKLAKQQAENLGVRFLQLDINPAYQALVKSFDSSVGKIKFGLVHENFQARLRGIFLMGLANLEQSLLLSTGNKSEFATGYSTLYGDMCGGLAPIGDVLKGDVYRLAELYNRSGDVIPAEVLTRAPTAELRANQKDQDSLPPYAKLDRAVQNLVEKQRPARGEVESWLLGLLMKTEFKRWQAPPILKISSHGFGRGRRMPIAHRAKS